MEGKNILLMAKMLKQIGHVDNELPRDMAAGFRLVGRFPRSKVFPLQTGEGCAFDFVCAFCLRYDQFWQSTVILAATGSATTMLQMTSMAGMTAVMVVIQQTAPITIF